MSHKLVLTELKPTELSSLGANVIQAMKSLPNSPKRILKFEGAVLARKEINKNNDNITAENLQELAATLPLNWIDSQHNTKDRVGFYIGARVQGDALATDGIIWTDDEPDLPQKLASGETQFSMEASADKAQCSICAKMFEREEDYCAHLTPIGNRFKYNASRTLFGMTATGGALTPKPAGTDTKADPNQIQMIAHVIMAQDATPEKLSEELTFMSETEYVLWENHPKLYASIFADDGAFGKKLSNKERKSLPAGKFALVQNKDGKTLRRFPIQDCNHARNALARLSGAKGLSAAERATVKSKAQAKLNSSSCKTKSSSAAILANQRFISMEWANMPTENVDGNPFTAPFGHPVMSPLMYSVEPELKPAPLGKNPVTEREVATEKVNQAAEQRVIADANSRIGGIAWLPKSNPQTNSKVVWKS